MPTPGAARRAPSAKGTTPLHTTMKDLQPNILNDYEHRVTRLIEKHGHRPDFPQMADHGVTQEELDDFLFDYQAVLDSEGSARTQQTLYGIIALVPLIIASAFPAEMLPWQSETMGVIYSLAAGIAIACAVKGVRTVIRRASLRGLRASSPDVARYVDAVLNYANP